MRTEFVRVLKMLLSRLGFLLLCVLVMIIGEWLPPMAAFQRFQEANPALNRLLLILTVAGTILGGLLMLLAAFLVHVPEPDAAYASKTVKTTGALKGRGSFFTGATFSAGFSDEARFWRVRQAFRDGEWWRVPRWRRLSLMIFGAVLMFYSLFALLFLLFPPGVKFLLLLLVLYATARGIYSFIMDQPFPQEADDGGFH